jgi:hypothetical protein
MLMAPVLLHASNAAANIVALLGIQLTEEAILLYWELLDWADSSGRQPDLLGPYSQIWPALDGLTCCRASMPFPQLVCWASEVGKEMGRPDCMSALGAGHHPVLG